MDTLISQMIKRASEALDKAYAPYSNFTVAACISTQTGQLYTGINIENGSYSLTLCAESAAIAAMVSAGERTIDQMVLLAGNNLLCPPCGACRQRIQEFSTPDTRIHLCNSSQILKSATISELLPLAFTL